MTALSLLHRLGKGMSKFTDTVPVSDFSHASKTEEILRSSDRVSIRGCSLDVSMVGLASGRLDAIVTGRGCSDAAGGIREDHQPSRA